MIEKDELWNYINIKTNIFVFFSCSQNNNERPNTYSLESKTLKYAEIFIFPVFPPIRVT